MKNKIITAGLMVVGAAGMQAALAAGADTAMPKFWNVSGTLRGFYDDNMNATQSKQESFGMELSPSVSLNVPLQQTDFGLRYTFGAFYYQERQDKGQNAWDYTHQVDLWMDHAFNERWRATVKDTVAIGQEPELLNSGAATPYRISGDNVANHGSVKLETDWTRLFGTAVAYQNSFYDYENSGTATLAEFIQSGSSRAGVLNRVEQKGSLDLNWTVQPETKAFVGYQFRMANYTGDEVIGFYAPRNIIYYSDSRDSMAHYGYVGVKHEISANLTGTIRGGVTYSETVNDPLEDKSWVTPYADLSLVYTYAQGSYVHFGVTQDMSATDVASVNQTDGSMTQNSEATVAVLDINHHFTEKLLGSVIGRYQYSTYNGGVYDGNADNVYGVGVNLHYQINRHLGADVGYNYDDLVSDVAGRGYDRNRVYIGLGANY